MAEEAQKQDNQEVEETKTAAEKKTGAATKQDQMTEAASRIKPGMVVRVHQKIKETTPKGDERERIQIFEGTVIAKKGKDAQSATITVRKIASGVGVERIFPLKMPSIAKIEEVKALRTRRSKLYFIRNRKKSLKEKKTK